MLTNFTNYRAYYSIPTNYIQYVGYFILQSNYITEYYTMQTYIYIYDLSMLYVFYTYIYPILIDELHRLVFNIQGGRTSDVQKKKFLYEYKKNF